MKFVSFQLNIAKESGKEAALRLESPFDEVECIESNKSFLFEKMPAIKEINILHSSSEEAAAVAGSEKVRADAAPGKPAVHFC